LSPVLKNKAYILEATGFHHKVVSPYDGNKCLPELSVCI